MCVNLQPNLNFLFRMKCFFKALCLITVASAMLVSCLKSNEDEVEMHDDALITSFTLGTLTRYYHPVSNPDTTVKATVTGSYYAMSIDHFGDSIFNRDSLPIGTVPRVLCTVATKNSGVVGLRGMGADTVYHYFVSTDSVDFSTPRWFRVVSTDGTAVHDYKVTLNIAKATADAFGWQKTDSIALPDGLDNCRPVVVGGKLKLVAGRNVAVKDGAVFVLSNQKLMRSTDAENWVEVADAANMKQLLGAGTKELFAIATNDSLMVLRDDSTRWTTEKTDESLALMPATHMACVSFPYASSKNTDYVLLVGTRVDTLSTRPLTTKAVSALWRKISFYTEAVAESQWAYMANDDANGFLLPPQDNLTMAVVGNKVLAMGNDLTIYETRDQGITWRKTTTYALPSSVGGSRALIAGDGESLWVVTDKGEVWHGRK